MSNVRIGMTIFKSKMHCSPLPKLFQRLLVDRSTMRATLKKVIVLRDAIYVRRSVEFHKNVNGIELAKSSFRTFRVTFVIALYCHEGFVVPTYHSRRVLLLWSRNHSLKRVVRKYAKSGPRGGYPVCDICEIKEIWNWVLSVHVVSRLKQFAIALLCITCNYSLGRNQRKHWRILLLPLIRHS